MPQYLLIVLLIFSSINAEAKKKRGAKVAERVQTGLVIDCESGGILHAENARSRIYPASLTKIMTLYIAFDEIDSGKLSMNRKLSVSKNAEKMLPCKLGLKAGETISVYHAVMALIVRSANDAAVVLAENIAGSEEAFAKKMNKKAKELGMKDTVFKNSSGWHHAHQTTTPLDLAKLAIDLKNRHYKFYHLFSATNFTFRGQKIKGHNKITENYPYADGLKTGYTGPAGYNLVTTASRNGKDIVAVVTGSPSSASRDAKMVKLLDKHLGVEPRAAPKKSVKKSVKVASLVKKKPRSNISTR